MILRPGLVLWFTGLSGVGKTTVATGVYSRLKKAGINCDVIDGDRIRATKHRNLGFTEQGIKENNNLIVNLCATQRQVFDVVLVSIISPYRSSRFLARARLSPGFYEIFVTAPLDCVRSRDTKGLYAKEANKQITNLIGVSPDTPYEIPLSPDLLIDTEKESASDSINALWEFAQRLLHSRKTLSQQCITGV